MEITKQQSIARVETIKSFFEQRITLDDVSTREKKLIKFYIEGLTEVRDYILQSSKKSVVGGLKGLILNLLIKKNYE